MNAQSFRIFANRVQAGTELAAAVATHHLATPLVVLGLPRGGVPVAAQVAHRLRAPLDVLVVRKVGMPGQPELAAGAIASGGVIVRNASLPADAVSDVEFARLARRELAELERRERTYRAGLPPLVLRDVNVVLVDDGLATGATMLAAVEAARRGGAQRVMVAVPVASSEAAARMRTAADAAVILLVPPSLGAIGEFYDDFAQLTDGEVLRLLHEPRT